ncbi:MAG TPA: FliG C-terminal domain-containing protein [Pirellulaceae bacterium]|nr:FliG C-terminal domain-containing protein [Pirellulaceae bacterium]
MPQPEPPKLDPIRKAAILISTLDHRVADELLERMPPDKAALVRSVAMELDDISEEEQRLVMREFLGSSDADDDAEESGVELDEELARKLASHENFVETPRASSEQEEPPFRFLRDAEADAIAKHLQHENPQIIAVVIAHLPPRQAADLLKHFDPQLQASLLRRIAELDSTDPDVVREVEKHLKMRLHDDLRAAKNRAIGLSTVASILTAAGETRGHLISSLTRHDRQLARQLRNPTRESHIADVHQEAFSHFNRDQPHDDEEKTIAQHNHSDVSKAHASAPPANEPLGDRADVVPVSFEELSRLGDADLALIFSEADSKLALLALAGATPSFVNRLLKQLPSREAKSLRRRMEQLGPLRLSDIAQAQKAIALIAGRLMALGEIETPHTGQFAVAA